MKEFWAVLIVVLLVAILFATVEAGKATHEPSDCQVWKGILNSHSMRC